MKIKQIITILALLYLGVASLIAQVVLLRELITAFYGNELFLGLTLALWLVSTGAGSLFVAKIFKRKLENVIAWLYLVFPAFLLSAFFLVRFSRTFLASGGVVPDLLVTLLWSALIIAPTALCLGILFVALAKTFSITSSAAIIYGYIIESLGFLVGALVFNFWLFELPTLTLFLLLACLSFAFSFLYSSNTSPVKASIAIILIVISVFMFSETKQLDKFTNGWNYPGELLLISEHTKYNTVHITRINEQLNFYLNGQLTTNSQNTYAHELITHLPLLLATNSPNVLLIGNGFTGMQEEINKYHPQNLVYLELDNDYFHLSQDILEYQAPTSTVIKFADARTYLRWSSLSFDVVIINFSNPSTLAENRLFTKEFFALINSNLAPGGLLVLKIDTAPNYLIGAQKDLLTALYQALQQTFMQVLALPENEVVFIASNRPIIFGQGPIDKRYQELNLENQYFFPAYISWRFSNDRTQALNRELSQLAIPPNSDLKPTLFYHQLKIFLEKMNLNKKIIPATILFFFLFLFPSFFAIKKSSIANFKLLISSMLPEFSLISFEVILILLFQTYHGFLYAQLSLIIATILSGIALGSLLSNKLMDLIPNLRQRRISLGLRLINYSFLIIIFSFALPLLVVWRFPNLLYGEMIYYAFSLFAGFAVGTKFPIINKLYLQKSTNLGAVYGADLIGGAIGALLAGTILLPVLGVTFSLSLLMLLSLLAFFILQSKSV
jgi:spermidine synthase